MHYDLDPEWIMPGTVEEALAELVRAGRSDERVHLMGGGTDLNVRIRAGDVLPRRLMDLNCIRGLDVIRELSGAHLGDLEGFPEGMKDIPPKERYIVLGATSTIDAIARDPLLQRRLPGVVKAAEEVGSPQIRNVATVGGNVMNASPAADMATMLLVLDTQVVLLSPEGVRVVPLTETFTGVCRTCVRDIEILAYFLIPPLDGRGTGFYKLKNRATLALSVVNAAAMLGSDGERITDAGVSVGAVAVTPLWIGEAARILAGKRIEAVAALFEEVGLIARERARPITDMRGSADYRKEMVSVCVQRALREALASLKEMKKGDGAEGAV